MSQKQDEVIQTGTAFEAMPITWRTPARKLTKEDLSATSALILGCTTQCCSGGCSEGDLLFPTIRPGGGGGT